MAIVPPTFVADELVTAAKMNLVPKGIIGYVKVTANQGFTTSEGDVTGLTVTFTAPANRLYKITAHIKTIQVTGAGGQVIRIMKDGAEINASIEDGALNELITHSFSTVDAPTAGSHTYKLRGVATANGFTSQTSATNPALIIVEDIGGV